MELEALQESLPAITAAGTTLVAISPQRREFSRQLVKRHGLSFAMLSDPGNRVARQFGIVFTLPDYLKELYLTFGINLEKFNGDDSWTLPMPARFIIDRNSVIRSVDADPDYTVRPEPAQTVAKLKELQRDRQEERCKPGYPL